MTTAVRSFSLASGAFFLTDAMPFSMAEVEEYISLRPIVWPLAAVRTKYGSPALEVLRSNRSSCGALRRTESMPFSALDLASYCWLVRMTSPLPALRLNRNLPAAVVLSSKIPAIVSNSPGRAGAWSGGHRDDGARRSVRAKSSSHGATGLRQGPPGGESGRLRPVPERDRRMTHRSDGGPRLRRAGLDGVADRLAAGLEVVGLLDAAGAAEHGGVALGRLGGADRLGRRLAQRPASSLTAGPGSPGPPSSGSPSGLVLSATMKTRSIAAVLSCSSACLRLSALFVSRSVSALR